MNKVYTVFGVNVQEEDIYKWPVKAYLSDKKALEHRDQANGGAEEGTEYFIYEIELDTASAPILTRTKH